MCLIGCKLINILSKIYIQFRFTDLGLTENPHPQVARFNSWAAVVKFINILESYWQFACNFPLVSVTRGKWNLQMILLEFVPNQTPNCNKSNQAQCENWRILGLLRRGKHGVEVYGACKGWFDVFSDEKEAAWFWRRSWSIDVQ